MVACSQTGSLPKPNFSVDSYQNERMSYVQGQRRIAGVGLVLVYAIGVGLIVGTDTFLAQSWIPKVSPSLIGLVVITLISFLLLPLDFIGGYVFPRQHGKSLQTQGQWWLAWGRGLLIWLGYMALISYTLVGIGNWIGNWGAIGWMAIMTLLLIGFQQYMARLVAGFKVQPGSNRGRLLFVFDTPERSFTGGISGMPGQESVIMPRYWYEQFGEKVADLQLARRHGALNTGSHGRGVLIAFFMNVLLFGLAVWLSNEAPGTTAWLLKTMGWFHILWLTTLPVIIPRLNRRGVQELDRWIFYQRVDADILRSAIIQTRRFQDESESLTHPLPHLVNTRPSAAQRFASLQTQADLKGAWHVFPNLVFFSWAGMNLAARSFPLNIGRPSLWVFMPGE